jgi:fused signal recognition particle receptor
MLRFIARRPLQMVPVPFVIRTHEALLMVDATTDSNALNQARKFQCAIGLTGFVVTMLDTSGKGGIVVVTRDQLQIPTRFVDTGEKIDDFAPFDASEFVGKMF